MNKDLEQFLSEKSIAIIGNSGCELGKSKGSIIDQHDVVIRFNNYSLNNPTDYGKKVDIWATSFCIDVNPPRQNFKYIMCPLPLYDTLILNNNYTQTNVFKLLIEKEKTNFIPLSIYNDLVKKIPNPSTGLCLLFWINHYAKINTENIFGFSFFNKQYKHHYYDEKNLCYHNGASEEIFFNSIFS